MNARNVLHVVALDEFATPDGCLLWLAYAAAWVGMAMQWIREKRKREGTEKRDMVEKNLYETTWPRKELLLYTHMCIHMLIVFD